jgi:signal peptidase I
LLDLALDATGVVVGTLGSWLLLKWLFHTGFGRAILVWLIGLIAIPVNLVGVYLLVKPFLSDAYGVPANSCAPTLVGPHQLGVCPNCGGDLMLRYDPEWNDPLEKDLGICKSCMRSGEAGGDMTRHAPDMFLCNKLLKPRRWDLVVFTLPREPATKIVKRVVGLPHETLVIKDGAIWINGARLQPPEDIAQLEFTPAFGHHRPEDSWGSEARPATLGADEYFVVGDFMMRSVDCREWGVPIERRSIEGVVTLRYAPRSRWHLFR